MKTVLTDINFSAANNTAEFIAECEERFDRDVSKVVKTFLAKCSCDIVLLAGPSSSGKTTTAGKIAEKIRQSGRNAFTVSLDDFYLNRDDIPDTEDGIKDFENVTALDIGLIHKVFSELIEKRCTELPVFDFITGNRSTQTKHIELGADDVIVVEGLHALNPVISEGLDESHLYRIYISVSSRVLDENSKVLLNKRNLRLARRIIRDSKHRNAPAENTLRQWTGVLKGEDMYLFPYESNADVKIDSFHPYEPCMIKQDILDELGTIGRTSEYYAQACELKKCFDAVEKIDSSLLPEASLLNEFLR